MTELLGKSLAIFARRSRYSTRDIPGVTSLADKRCECVYDVGCDNGRSMRKLAECGLGTVEVPVVRMYLSPRKRCIWSLHCETNLGRNEGMGKLVGDDSERRATKRYKPVQLVSLPFQIAPQNAEL